MCGRALALRELFGRCVRSQDGAGTQTGSHLSGDSIPANHLIREYIDLEAFRKVIFDWEKGYREIGAMGHPILSVSIARVLGMYVLLEGIGSEKWVMVSGK